MSVKAYKLDKKALKTPSGTGNLKDLESTLDLKDYIRKVLADSTTNQNIDLNGKKLIFDVDADTYFIASTDDTIEMYLNGVKYFTMTAGALTYTAGTTVSFGSVNTYKATTGLTALAGGAQAGTALTSELNDFTTVATTADSAQLPVAVLGKRVKVRNSAAKAMAVFGQTGDTIDGNSANVSVTIEPGQEKTFEAISGTAWLIEGGHAGSAIGAVTQGTSITTGVTINSIKGLITTFSASTAALGSCTFTVTNNKATATSNVRAWLVDYAGTILTNGVPVIIGTDNHTSSGFDIIYVNTHATNALSGAIKIGFEIMN